MGGISGVFGAVALLGFLAFLGGVGLVVVAASQGRPVRGGVLLAVVGLLFGIVLSVVSQGVIVVEPQEVAVVFQTVSGDLGPPRRAGTHIIIPILQDATIYPITSQEYTMSGTGGEGRVSGDDAVVGRTNDGQEIRVDVTVIYRVNPDQVNLVHERWQNRYESDFIRPTARGRTQAVIANYEAAAIYGDGRVAMENQVQTEITALMAEQGLELLDLLIRDITFTQEFADSIEQAQIAAQDAERARLQIQVRQNEAEQVRATAAGARDAEIARAEGDAQATILRAQAQAEALRLVSVQIAANPSLIQYEYVQRLSDQVSVMLVPSNSPFLFDFESLAEADPNFQAPAVPAPEEIVTPDDESGTDGSGN